MASKTLLDTNILSALMRREAVALERAREYLSIHSQLSISIIMRYEVTGGLKAKNASGQLKRFETLCASLEILSLSDLEITRAADIYADLYRRGQLIGDADILIAATAIENGFVLATNNTNHYGHIPGLTIDNWLQTP